MKKTDSAATEAARTATAMEEMEEYCRQHPRSPSALKRPRILPRGDLFVALFGATLQDGIAGMGSSVSEALRAFDMQFPAATPRG